ncbi:Hypothetical predicted protein [Podarcis lilfordi]|uniref:Uncharacterized protein n=1 Tax=Podarcis lilfordi TaxID=74358 RepID=A0AA35LM44_9SAUR|nr:Hypothetical predicted protein [Podarcis lilfordi]
MSEAAFELWASCFAAVSQGGGLRFGGGNISAENIHNLETRNEELVDQNQHLEPSCWKDAGNGFSWQSSRCNDEQTHRQFRQRLCILFRSESGAG